MSDRNSIVSHTKSEIDFSNTEIAFSSKSDRHLKFTTNLFKLMNSPTLVNIGTRASMWSLKLHLPLVKSLIRNTIFKQFCGGIDLMDTQKTVDELQKFRVLTILDYGAEGLSEEKDLDETKKEFLRAIAFAASNSSVPVVSIKITGIASNDLLMKAQREQPLNEKQRIALARVEDRLDEICRKASELDVGVFVDAEQSWMQTTIDRLVVKMMEKYNRNKAIVYNTYQMYRHDHLALLQHTYEEAKAKGYLLGAKIVRGAYMNRERQLAKEKGYPSPIHKNKVATDRDYNAAIKFLVDHYEDIASCNASHNLKSNQLMAELIANKNIHRNHPHLNFCQLYGMSDNITFNLAAAGYNVAKYVIYGPVEKVIHYLMRRAQENTSVTGDMSRELALLSKEMKRRKQS